MVLDQQTLNKIIESGGFSNTNGNYYVIMEPLLLVTYNSVGYLGTAYELAYQFKNKSLGNLVNVLRIKLPLAIYLSNNQEEDEINYFVKDGNNKSFWRVDDSQSKKDLKNIITQQGYGLGAFWLRDLITRNECDYYNPAHFETINSGPNGENCCEHFNNSSYPNLVEDHPECGYCPELTKITLIDKNKIDGSPINYNGHSVGVNDTSDRCSLGNDSKFSTPNRNSQYTVEDSLENGIENNTCLTMTSIDENAGTIIKKNLFQNICYVKCIEEDDFSIPSNPLITTSSSHFIWPTSPSTSGIFGNNYPLKATGKTTCRIVINTVTLNNTYNNDAAKKNAIEQCANNLINHLDSINTFNPKIELKHNYEKNGVRISDNLNELQTYNETETCLYGTTLSDISENVICSEIPNKLVANVSSKSNVNDKIKALRSFGFSITKSMGFKLNAELNAYINRENGQRVSDLPSHDNYEIIGYGNIPVNFFSNIRSFSYNETASAVGNLELIVSNVSSHFDNIGSMSCDVGYEAHSGGPSSRDEYNYLCREGITNRIIDVSQCKINGIFSTDCIRQKCSKPSCSETTTCPGCEISNSDWDYIYNTYRSSYSEYDALRFTQDYFDNSDQCNTDIDHPECPEDSAKPHYDISSCVNSKLASSSIGYDEAVNICRVEEKCYKIPNIIAVYRSIDLNNPFPSINGLGRLPGNNWNFVDPTNNKTMVESYITDNRGVTTTEIYNQTPLYTFELNTSTIKKIRQYNVNSKYDEFDVDCVSGRNCISSFVHNVEYGFISSASACNSSNKFDFGRC